MAGFFNLGLTIMATKVGQNLQELQIVRQSKSALAIIAKLSERAWQCLMVGGRVKDTLLLHQIFYETL